MIGHMGDSTALCMYRECPARFREESFNFVLLRVSQTKKIHNAYMCCVSMHLSMRVNKGRQVPMMTCISHLRATFTALLDVFYEPYTHHASNKFDLNTENMRTWRCRAIVSLTKTVSP